MSRADGLEEGQNDLVMEEFETRGSEWIRSWGCQQTATEEMVDTVMKRMVSWSWKLIWIKESVR